MERRLAAILTADVVGYSRLMEIDEAGTLIALKAHREKLIDPAIAEHQGRLVKLMGDGALVEFASVVNAVTCAVAIQAGMTERNRDEPEDSRIALRIGIHLGDVIVDDEDIYGDGVNVSARLEGLADAGGICISQQVFDQIETKLDLSYEDLEEQQVKNIARPVRAYRVLVDRAAPAARRKPRRRGFSPPRPIVSTAVVIVIAAGLLATWWQPWKPNVEPTSIDRITFPLPDKPSIAVLPFTNLGGDPEQEYFADGITDDLITDLSKLSGLFVISRNSAFTYKGKAVNVPAVARELGVRYILEGSVRRVGEIVRINAQLIDATTGGHVWADRYDGTFDNIFALQDQVIGQIVAELKVQLSTVEQGQITRIPTRNLEAYDQYLRAEEEGYYVADAARQRRTLGFYKRAIELDPEFADAYAGYARTLVEVLRLGYDDLLAGAVARKDAYNAAGRALVLDPENARAYTVLAVLQMVDGRHNEAIESARRAVSLSPNSAEARINLGLVLAYSGQPAEAVDATEAALRLSPRPQPGVQLFAGVVFYFDRQYERAIAFLERVRADLPASELALEYLAASYAHVGRQDDAGTMRQALVESLPMVSLAYYRLWYRHFKRKEDLDRHLEGLRKAGIKPWPFDYQARLEDRLSGDAIAPLILDKVWQGVLQDAKPFVQENAGTGTFAYKSSASLLIGTIWVDGDRLCQRSQGYLLGRAACGHVYRNADKGQSAGHEYVYVTPVSIRHFTVSN